MPDNAPSADQIHAYLLANGWQMGESGRAAYLMVRMGQSIRMLHEPTEYDLDKAVFDISLAEGRHPADTWEDILACAVAAVPDTPVVGGVIATLTSPVWRSACPSAASVSCPGSARPCASTKRAGTRRGCRSCLRGLTRSAATSE